MSSLAWLVADIGGTHARFGWVDDLARGVGELRTLVTAEFAGPDAAAAAYLAELGRQRGLGKAPAPRRAAFAVATAVLGDSVALTNAGWRFSQSGLQRALGVDRLRVLNDFEALALALPRLVPSQYRPWGEAPGAEGPLAVIGPGTGLGVGAVMPTPAGWLALAGEGGHATLAAGDDFESALLQFVRARHAHVSAERLLSGIGLPLLHEAVAALQGLPAPALSTADIVGRGAAADDPLCRHTLECFCALLGGFAGNAALTLGARGGLYVGGGLVPRFEALFFGSAFRARFEAKGRFAPYLASIPTALITDTGAALTGAATALESP